MESWWLTFSRKNSSQKRGFPCDGSSPWVCIMNMWECASIREGLVKRTRAKRERSLSRSQPAHLEELLVVGDQLLLERFSLPRYPLAQQGRRVGRPPRAFLFVPGGHGALRRGERAGKHPYYLRLLCGATRVNHCSARKYRSSARKGSKVHFYG